MYKLTRQLPFLALLVAFSAQAQTTADFENISIPPAGFINDSGSAGFFYSGNAAVPNFYDSNFDYWDGWAISKTTDTITPGFTNQYSAIAGGGAQGTTNYGVCYAFGETSLFLEGPAKGGTLSGIYVTNGTYAYFSMKEGDNISKKFGGETGSDPDFFKLTIKGYNNNIPISDSIVFYLADYRSANNSQDYIVDEWTYIDLKPLGAVEEITFSLSSSDNGAFGMNTPAYLCADQLVTDDNTTGITEAGLQKNWQVSPNPAHGFIRLEWSGSDAAQGAVYDAQGRTVKNFTAFPGINVIDLQGFTPGVYAMRIGGRTERIVVVN